jgi:TRAP-type C4-dicarboxylate transport system substrate-binding protein
VDPGGHPIAKAVLDAAGLAPVPLPLSDVLTGLQTGLLDTVASPPVGAVALQWFTKARYLTDQPLVYAYGSIVIAAKAFAKLDPADQEIVREVLERVSKTLDQRSRADNTSAREALLKQGVQLVAVSPSEEQRWHQVAAKAGKLLAGGGKSVAPDLVARLDQLLAAYRAQHGG